MILIPLKFLPIRTPWYHEISKRPHEEGDIRLLVVVVVVLFVFVRPGIVLFAAFAEYSTIPRSSIFSHSKIQFTVIDNTDCSCDVRSQSGDGR